MADGIGLRIFVHSGALVVEDGVGEHRRTRHFDKATHGLGSPRGHGCDRHLDPRRLALVPTPRHRGAGSRPRRVAGPRNRAPAHRRRAAAEDAGAVHPNCRSALDLARELIGRKMTGQSSLLARRFDDAETADAIVRPGRGIAGHGDDRRGATARSCRRLSLLAELGRAARVRPPLRHQGPQDGPIALDSLRGPALGALVGQRQPQGGAAGERIAQLPLRPPRSRGHPGLPGGGARPRARHRPFRHPGPPEPGARHHGTGAARGRRLRPRPPGASHLPQGGVHRDHRRALPPAGPPHPRPGRDPPAMVEGARTHRRAGIALARVRLSPASTTR